MTSSKVPKQYGLFGARSVAWATASASCSVRTRAWKSPQSMNHVPGGSDDLVGDLGEAVTDGPVGDEAQGALSLAWPTRRSPAPEYKGVDHEPQIIDEVARNQRWH